MDSSRYLREHLRVSIVNEVMDAALFHSRRARRKSGGFFSIPLLVFCYVDFLGSLRFGLPAGSVKAIKFIKQYFPDRYRAYAELLYTMWRHGTVHEHSPKKLFSVDSETVFCKVGPLANNKNNRKNRANHLKTFNTVGINRDVFLCVNTCALVDD